MAWLVRLGGLRAMVALILTEISMIPAYQQMAERQLRILRRSGGILQVWESSE